MLLGCIFPIHYKQKRFAIRFQLLKAAIASACTLFLVSCAHQSSPGGGPEDKAAPEISTSTPSSGQVNVDASQPITVVFSEWISPSTAFNAVTIYPVLPAGLQVKVSGKRLEIKPREPLRDNTTYHVNIATTLQDLHGNSIVKPINLIFSTGPSLDSAQLSGCVLSDVPLVVLPKVGLYREGESWSDTSYFGYPDYMMQTDSTGFFHFTHLKEGRYRILSFHDRNSDGRLGTGDPCFSSVEKSLFVRTIPGSVELYPVESDTLPPKVISLSAIDRQVIKGAWNRKFDIDRFPSAQFTVKALSSDLSSPKIKQAITTANDSIFYVTLQDSLANGIYQLSYSYASIKDSARFNGISTVDTTRPSLKFFLPQGASNLSPQVSLLWNKPVRISQSMVIAVDSLGTDSVPFLCANKFSDSTILSPTRNLKPGTFYSFSIPLLAIKDITGNSVSGKQPQDSTLNFGFSTVSPDSLCYVLQGGAPCFSSHPQRRWSFRPFARKETFTVRDSAGTFTFDSIPASKGFISWFIDVNNDNRPTPGRLVPWRAPEPHFTAPDTVEARARWEIENVQVQGCEPCSRSESK